MFYGLIILSAILMAGLIMFGLIAAVDRIQKKYDLSNGAAAILFALFWLTIVVTMVPTVAMYLECGSLWKCQ